MFISRELHVNVSKEHLPTDNNLIKNGYITNIIIIIIIMRHKTTPSNHVIFLCSSKKNMKVEKDIKKF